MSRRYREERERIADVADDVTGDQRLLRRSHGGACRSRNNSSLKPSVEPR
ncbi:hypothetical protein Hanom_Chr14g01250131 [Helianthus anomalus]